MTVATRSSSSSPVKKPHKEHPTEERGQQKAPLKHFILPKDTSRDARFVLLRHPRDSILQRFLFCPEKGLFHFTKIHAPNADPRSLLFSQTCALDNADSSRTQGSAEANESLSSAYISQNADFFVATPFDIAFILIPLLLTAKAPTGRNLFQPMDDILEPHTQEDKNLRYIVENSRAQIEEAMSRFCDTIEAGEEQMYRPSEAKTLDMIQEKVGAAIRNGLPPSLEEKFVTRALEAPILSVKREETITSIKSAPTPPEDNDSASESLDSQGSTTSSVPSAVFSASSDASSISTILPDSVPQDLHDLQKQSTVLEFILSSYLPDSIGERLKARFRSQDSPINFTPLEVHLKSLAALRAEAIASRSMGDFSRKRELEEEEAADLRAEKKRKLEEEDRKKKLGESRGVRELKKVNVSGMKKMSDFFAKKPSKSSG